MKEKKSFSLNRFVWIYILVFWSFVPFLQYNIGIFSWGISLSDFQVLWSILITILWVATYNFFQVKFSSRYSKDGHYKSIQTVLNIQPVAIILLVTIQFFIFIYFFNVNNGVIFFRGDFDPDAISGKKSEYLIINTLFRALCAFITFTFAYNFVSKKTFWRLFLFIMILVLHLLTNFPLAIPRYMAGAFYIPLFFIFKPHYRINSIPSIALIILFIVIYPALSIFRTSDQGFSELQITLLANTFLTGDFDNFTILSMVIDYVQKNSITYGGQLLGVVLFFIPRTIWTTKPIGSGAFLAEADGWSFTNISCSFIGEGYLNFGFLGVFIFAVFTSYIVSRLDSSFSNSRNYSFLNLLYLAILGMIFFILRGDMMSSFAYCVSFCIAAFIIYKISRISI